MSKLAEIRSQRKAAADTISQMADLVGREKRDFTSEEKARWDKANADYDRLARDERAEQVRDEQARRAGDPDVGREDYTGRRGRREGRRTERVQHTEEQRGHAFRAWCRRQMGLPLRREERAACKALRFNPATQEMRLDCWPDRKLKEVQTKLREAHPTQRGDIIARESRANMSAQLPTSGGYLVAPGTLSSSLEVNLLAFGGALQVADVMTTQTGEPFLWPTADDTSNSGALLAENTSVGSGVNPSLAQKLYSAYKFSSTPVLIPTELLEDSQFDLPSLIGEMLGTRLGRGMAPYLATGTGASQPEGIITGASSALTTASATAITLDELIRLVHSIDPAYRGQPGSGFMMHDNVISYIRRIKDGNGRPLWQVGETYQSGIREGVADKLLGYTVNTCQEMASAVTTGLKTVLFGVLSKFKVRKVRDVRMYRLQERYRDLDQDGFIAFQRIDSKILQAGTVPIKYITQA